MYSSEFERALLSGRELTASERDRLDTLRWSTYYIKKIRKEELRK